MLRKAQSIFFLNEVRMGKALSGIGHSRISLMGTDIRYEAFVNEGIEVQIRDKQQPEVVIHVPWHLVRDYELAPEAKEKSLKGIVA